MQSPKKTTFKQEIKNITKKHSLFTFARLYKTTIKQITLYCHSFRIQKMFFFHWKVNTTLSAFNTSLILPKNTD